MPTLPAYLKLAPDPYSLRCESEGAKVAQSWVAPEPEKAHFKRKILPYQVHY